MIGSILARLILSITSFYYFREDTDYTYIHAAVFLLLVVDVINNIVYFTTRKFRREIEEYKFMEHINKLLGKISAILRNPYIGYFTTNEEGIIEFANAKMKEILEDSSPLGSNIFGYLLEEVINNIKIRDDYNADVELIVKGKFKKVKLCTSRTVNGHVTITGSVLE